MINAAEAASQMKLAAKLMEFHGENAFKVRAFQNGARTIKSLGDELGTRLKEGTITQVKGIGKGLAEELTAMASDGKSPLLDSLLDKTPEGVLDLLNLPGIGPKKVRLLHEELGVETLGELNYACQENRLVSLKGFGAKTQANVLEAIAFQTSHAHEHLLVDARDLFEVLRARLDGSDLYLTGAAARWEPVVSRVELLTTEDPGLFSDALDSILSGKLQADSDLFVGESSHGIPIALRQVPKAELAFWRWSTSSAETHRAWVEAKGDVERQSPSDEAIYESAGLPFTPIECRVDDRAQRWHESGAWPQFVEMTDIEGVFHNHSTWSDGAASIATMAEAAAARGYRYFGLSDHSKSSVYANGLSVDQLNEQKAEIGQWNAGSPACVVLHGVEADILADGRMDYDDQTLGSLDFVVGSIHSAMRQDEDTVTTRMLRAVAHPAVTMIGHPTGRLLLARQGYPLAMSRFIEACAESGTVIELNASPYRLDIDEAYLAECRKHGVLISISPDAHNVEMLDHVAYGVALARRAGLEAKDILNARALEAIRDERGRIQPPK